MRARLLALVIALLTLGTTGAVAARAATVTPPTTGGQPWACVGERDIDVGVCLYNPLPEAPQSATQR